MFQVQVSGPGLTSATVNHPTHILVELTDSSGRPYSLPLNITAQLQLVSKTIPTSHPEAVPTSLSSFSCETNVHVAMTSPSRYEASYTPVIRGQHKLHVQVNNREINGSPFTVTVYPDPRQIGLPVRTIANLGGPYSIAFTSTNEMIVTECGGHRLSIFDASRQKVRTIGSPGDNPHQMMEAKGVATDKHDNIYVSSKHKLQKFRSGGDLESCIGKAGKKEGEFADPREVTIHNDKVYVADIYNHRVQVFDLGLNFVQSFGSRGKGNGEFDEPQDVQFDADGRMYVAEWGNSRVQVLQPNGQFIKSFGTENLRGPSGLHMVDKYVYVSDLTDNCIVVLETSGQFVTSFGKFGQNEGEFCSPRCITSCADGFIHVCDSGNNRVQIF